MGPLVSRLPRTPFEPLEVVDGRPAEAQQPGAEPGPPSGAEPGPPLGRLPVAGFSRRSLAGLLSALVVLWIVVVFARAVADSAAATARADQLRESTAAQAARLEAERRELDLVQTPAYMKLRARAYGYGAPNERVFGLQAGAPHAAVITPLGADPDGGSPRSPLDDWLALLFGP